MSPPLSPRYEFLELIGFGGMGEVFRVRDPLLGRTLAMKVLRAELLGVPEAVARFTEEAQATAQLQHPGTVPVHDMGLLEDGRHFFTMQEIRGRTLTEVIAEVHGASTGQRWQASAKGWTFHRLIDAFRKACETVAYAHSRGVVHRDLKPDNVMVGEHGEVLVVDWGLAKVLGRPERDYGGEAAAPVVTDRSLDGSMVTQMGAVAGTPAYMPPEQARGEHDKIDARSDVYSLGAILYELLSGHPPYRGETDLAVVVHLLTSPPTPLGRWVERFGEAIPRATPLPIDTSDYGVCAEEGSTCGPPLPEELVTACERAMEREREKRFADAAELAQEVGAWLEGSRQRTRAMVVVDESERLAEEAEALRGRARELRETARRALEAVEPWEPTSSKSEGWALEDEAERLEREADLLELRATQALHAALTHAPDLVEAHEALAERYLHAHAAVEAARDLAATDRAEELLRTHVASLPEGSTVRDRSIVYLKGDGALTLRTDPEGAEVSLHAIVTQERRLVPAFERVLGRTPLVEVPLPMGSYLLVLRAPGRATVRYPVQIGRNEHWDGVAPGAEEATLITLPRQDELDPDELYVPPGWFWAGGDRAASEAEGRRLWCEGFVLGRFPVTNAEYLAFLNALVADGREEEALRSVPRERSGAVGRLGAMLYGRDTDGRFILKADGEGDHWHPRWPVVMVDWACANAYRRWRSSVTGRAYRLPAELEWEKAARGVDGRFFPWGDFLDPSWCAIRDSFPDRPLPQPVESYPGDVSVYGARGLGGNVRDWCADPYARDGPRFEVSAVSVEVVGAPRESGVHQQIESASPRRSIRGGDYSGSEGGARSALRRGGLPTNRSANLGFRLARALRP